MMDGSVYDAVHIFTGDRRAIVNMDGAYVIATRVTIDVWDCMSGDPARPGEELDTLNGLVRALGDGTTVTVTEPDE